MCFIKVNYDKKNILKYAEIKRLMSILNPLNINHLKTDKSYKQINIHLKFIFNYAFDRIGVSSLNNLFRLKLKCRKLCF